MDAFGRKALLPLIKAALREDQASRDITSQAVIPPGLRIRARVLAGEAGVLAGVKLAALVFTTQDRWLRCRLHLHSGAALSPGKTILTIEGRARSIFAAERTALNLLGHLCGIATLTRAYVRRAGGTKAAILDTRKTLPGLRALEKDAVRAGGGQSHRSDLAEAVLIKTNHLRVASCVPRRASKTIIRDLIRTARQKTGGKFVEIEVSGFKEFRAALEAGPDAILLDNWRISNIRRAVRLRTTHDARRRTPLEVSGGVTLANIRAIARTGVDRISVGRLTHSAPSLDVALKVLT